MYRNVKQLIQYLNIFAIDHCRFISHREHNVIRDNTLSAPCWTSSIYMYLLYESFGEHCNIQIVIDYEMKLKIYFISSFWLNLFEYIIGYVYIIYL